MTHQEQYISFLETIGFTKVEPETSLACIPENHYLLKEFDSYTEVFLGQGIGYSGFFSWMEFDKDGKFSSYGSGE